MVANRFCGLGMRLELPLAVIRSWSLADADALQRYANNRSIWINLRDEFPHPYTPEDARAFLSRVTQEKPETVFAVTTPSDAIGGIGLRLGSDIHRKSAELGYWLAEPFEHNRASARVLEKAGFVCEGRIRAAVFKDGKVLDSFLYARVRDDAFSKK